MNKKLVKEEKWKQEGKRAREIGGSENQRGENSEEYEVPQSVYSYVGVIALDLTDKLHILWNVLSLSFSPKQPCVISSLHTLACKRTEPLFCAQA